ncbi:MAG: PEP-CTERM sorting domain-containing protein [Thiobacillus sp.]|nr:PEP-CTERM sorting domain-containing protein [Thiobacillus sp.]
MHTKSVAIALIVGGFSMPALAGIPLASSTFATDAEGWGGLTTTGSPDWSVVASVGPLPDMDGNPDFSGSIVLIDPDNHWTYFSAPATFLGDKSSAFGGTLSFDYSVFTPGTGYANEAEVVLKGAGMTLVYDATSSLLYTTPISWSHIEITLSGGGWRVGDIFSGAPASNAQLLAVLSDLDALWINAEHYTPEMEAIALDNVVLSAPVPEPRTWIMMGLGLALLGRLFKRQA